MREGWQTVKLGDICVVDWGNTSLTKKSLVEGGEFLAVSAAGCDGRIGHKEHSKNTPVLSAIGANCGRMFFPDEDFTAIKNTITITPLSDKTTGKFLFHILSSVKLPQRGAAQPFISKGDLQKFSIPLPPLTEQERIVSILDKLKTSTHHLEALYTQKLNDLKELKQSLLQQAFAGELTKEDAA